MVFTVKENDAFGATIFSTSTALVNNTAPTIFFRKDSFAISEKPVWVENKALQREGNFTHYAGSDDSEMKVFLCLYGPNRNANLATVRGIKDVVFYLDASDIEAALTGKYVVKGDFKYERDEPKQLVVIEMTWKRYNN